MRLTRLIAIGLGWVLVVGACSGDDGGGDAATTTASPATTAPISDVAVPDAVKGPIDGGRYGVPYNALPASIAEEYDYTEAEYFLSGEATAYTAAAPLSEDGEWSVTEGGTAPYTTRVIARRPADPDEFNGTVVVEWLNVSAGRDSDPAFSYLYPLLLDQGYGYVGVTAQIAGIEPGGAGLEVPGVPEESLDPLKVWDPERYEPLDHPGDEYAFDIYSQVAQALRQPAEIDLLDGLTATDVIAIGESQSALALGTYVNGAHPEAGVYDAFLIQSRGAGGLDLNPDPPGATPGAMRIRTDLDEPVLQFETETDLITLNHIAARQDDTDSVVTWEVAGLAHVDREALDYGILSGQEWNPGATLDIEAECGVINDGPMGPALRAAFTSLVDWTDAGEAPSTTPDIEIVDGEIVRDPNGLAVGGARLPAVDAPISELTGITDAPSVFCSLFGAAEPFTDQQLAALYDSREDYVQQVTDSADAAVAAGWLLPEDRDAMIDEAEAADVPPSG